MEIDKDKIEELKQRKEDESVKALLIGLVLGLVVGVFIEAFIISLILI